MVAEIGALSHLVEAATALANLDMRNKKSRGSISTTIISEKRKQLGSQHGQCALLDEVPTSTRTVMPIPMPRNKREIFPQRLLCVLNEPSLAGVISWLPHGRAFVIIRPDVFTEEVMPTYFPPVDSRGSTKYPSFTRKLNRWGFRQATRGPDTGAFHHPLFQRDRPELCVDMVCQRSRSQANGHAKLPEKIPATQLAAVSKPKRDVDERHHSELTSEPEAKVAPLTKESIDRLLPTPDGLSGRRTAATVSLDETRSVASHNSATSITGGKAAESEVNKSGAIKGGISTDRGFVDKVVRQRDEIERLRVAQALLYKAFTSAVQQQSRN